MSMEPETLACALAGRCGGCPWMGRTISDQISGRLHALRALWSEVGLPEADLDAVLAYLERGGAELMLQAASGPGRRFRTAPQERPHGRVVMASSVGASIGKTRPVLMSIM